VIATKIAPVIRYNVTIAALCREMKCIATRIAFDSDDRPATAATRA